MSADEDVDYGALSFAQTSEMYMVAGVVGVLVDLLVLLSYFFVPNIKAQHPAADVVIWQVACGLMLSLGLIVAYVAEDVVRPNVVICSATIALTALTLARVRDTSARRLRAHGVIQPGASVCCARVHSTADLRLVSSSCLRVLRGTSCSRSTSSWRS